MIQTVVYDKDERQLTVRFVSGRVYSYAEVPAEIATGFATASSQGHYFNEYVRDRFPFVRSRGGQVDRRRPPAPDQRS